MECRHVIENEYKSKYLASSVLVLFIAFTWFSLLHLNLFNITKIKLTRISRNRKKCFNITVNEQNLET